MREVGTGKASGQTSVTSSCIAARKTGLEKWNIRRSGLGRLKPWEAISFDGLRSTSRGS